MFFFCALRNFASITKELIYNKKPNYPSCINLTQTNCLSHLLKSLTFENSFFYFHKMQLCSNLKPEHNGDFKYHM